MSANGTRRVNRGRSHTYYIDGEKVPGITTILSQGFPKPALSWWAAKAAAQEVLDFWDDLVDLAPSDRFERIRTAPDRDRDVAARRGSEVHALAERLARGEEVDVADELVGHVDAYLAFAREWQPAELLVERPVYSREWRYAGTPDLFAVLNDGRTWLLDWKTNRSGVFVDHVLQLAAARYAQFVIDDAGNEQPLPKVDATGIVWLRADGYDLYPVEADERAWRYFLWVRRVAEFATSPRDEWIGEALRPGVSA